MWPPSSETLSSRRLASARIFCGSWPMTRCSSSRTAASVGLMKPLSVPSPSPTRPVSVWTWTKRKFFQPAPTVKVSMRVIFMESLAQDFLRGRGEVRRGHAVALGEVGQRAALAETIRDADALKPDGEALIHGEVGDRAGEAAGDQVILGSDDPRHAREQGGDGGAIERLQGADVQHRGLDAGGGKGAGGLERAGGHEAGADEGHIGAIAQEARATDFKLAVGL